MKEAKEAKEGRKEKGKKIGMKSCVLGKAKNKGKRNRKEGKDGGKEKR